MSRVILLHGVGSSGANMSGLAAALALAVVACPDGPEPFEMGPGRQWFSVRGITEENRPTRVAAAMPGFRKMVESLGPVEESVLIGFSQGAIMALHAVADGLPVKAVFAHSGRLAGPVTGRKDWPPITLLHARQDGVMPVQVAQATEAWLRDAGAAPDLHLFDGLAHGMDDRSIAVLRAGLAAG